MPDWISNKIVVSGAGLKGFLATMGTEGTEFSFHQTIKKPLPKETWGWRGAWGVISDATDVECEYNIDKINHTDTITDIINPLVKENGIGREILTYFEDSITIRCDTPWDAPYKWIHKCMKKFDIVIEIFWYDDVNIMYGDINSEHTSENRECEALLEFINKHDLVRFNI